MLFVKRFLKKKNTTDPFMGSERHFKSSIQGKTSHLKNSKQPLQWKNRGIEDRTVSLVLVLPARLLFPVSALTVTCYFDSINSKTAERKDLRSHAKRNSML